ncbi:pentapeptide repeat-containing protein [Escherichia coli]|nr:pentapeptide repeat-containing protein [Escherichia coli]
MLTWKAARLHNAQLQGIKTQNVKLKNVKFGCADLKDADLRGADLNLTDLYYANMTNAILPSNSEFDPADMKLMTTKGARFANEKELNNEFLNEETGAGTRTAEAIPSEQLVKAGDLSEEPAYQELDIRDDGYGFFRCVLLQNTKDDKWAQCSTKEVYNKINHTYINIFNPIADAFREMEETLLNVNNEKLAVIVSDLGKLLPNIVTDKGFYLWSPKEICMCHGINYEELSTKDVASLETFCNAVFTKLQSALTLNMDKSKGSYATIEDAHYTWHKKLDR